MLMYCSRKFYLSKCFLPTEDPKTIIVCLLLTQLKHFFKLIFIIVLIYSSNYKKTFIAFEVVRFKSIQFQIIFFKQTHTF